jgi:serine/threonine protein kinase
VNCPSCQGEIYEIDVKCSHCGAAVGATGAHRMLGQTVLAHYELVDVLGQGGMSVVFKGRHTMTSQEVALKILPPELAAHSQVKGRFLEEAKALAALDHPNIVHLYNFGQENGSFVLAMQYVQGRTWERMILENQRLDWKVSCRIAIDVLKALEYAHGRGVVHRDMKPSNVLVRESDGAATVMDFGIAKMAQSTKLTATGQTMGTVRYMSPEQVRGQEVDLRTDIYSLGATLYESLVGDTPFDGQTHFEIMTKHLSDLPKPPSKLGIAMPKPIEDAIMRSLLKKATDRFDNARDMRKILETALAEGGATVVETQRLHREMVVDTKPTKDEKVAAAASSSLGLAQTARASTATSLADELEPGSASRPVRPRRAKSSARWPFVVLALVVLGGGAATAALVLKKGAPAGYQSKNKVGGVKLTAGNVFENQLLIETDGAVTPEEIAPLYKSMLDEIVAFEPGTEAQRDVIQEIVAVPQAQICEESITRVSPIPCSHKDTYATALRGKKRQLIISSDRAQLPQTLRIGVAAAVCEFQFMWLTGADDENARKNEVICSMTKRFIGVK